MKINFQKYLVGFFDNFLGRWYLGVPKGKHIARITPTGCHYFTGELSKRNGLPVICTGNRSPGQRDIIRQKIMRLASVVSFFAFLPFFPVSLLPLVALTDTGWNSPSTNGKYYSDFTNPDNAYSSNDEYATAEVPTFGNKGQSWETFGFGVPAGLDINGIEISVEWFVSGDIQGGSLSPWVYSTSDADWGDTSTCPRRTVEGIDYRGGADVLWNKTWESNDFSDANFSLYFNGGGGPSEICYFSIDHIQVKVYYTEAITEKSVSDSGSGSEAVGVKTQVGVDDLGQGAEVPSKISQLKVEDKNLPGISYF